MEGLEDFAKSKIYLTIQEGKICMRSNENDEKATMREVVDKKGVKTGQVVWERYFKSVFGMIQEFKTEVDQKFNTRRLIIEFKNNANIYVLQVNIKTRYAQAIILRMKNIQNFTDLIKISTYKFEGENGKMVMGANVFKMGNNLEWEKLPDAYREWDDALKTYSKFNYGYPQWPAGELEKEDKEKYVLNLTSFLKDEVAKMREIVRATSITDDIEMEDIPEKARVPQDNEDGLSEEEDDLPF